MDMTDWKPLVQSLIFSQQFQRIPGELSFGCLAPQACCCCTHWVCASAFSSSLLACWLGSHPDVHFLPGVQGHVLSPISLSSSLPSCQALNASHSIMQSNATLFGPLLKFTVDPPSHSKSWTQRPLTLFIGPALLKDYLDLKIVFFHAGK